MSAPSPPPSPPAPTGPVATTAEVLTTRRVGAFVHLALAAPDVAERARPGTFVMLGPVAGATSPRAFWIRGVRAVGGFGSAVEVVVEPTGATSRAIADLPVGATLALTGPLGRPFSLPRSAAACVLVGEGHATACLFGLAARLKERGCVVTMLLAAPDEPRLLAALEARRTARSVTVVTVDGSVGRRVPAHDPVGEVLPDLLRRAGAEVVYAAGPTAVLAASARTAAEHGAHSQTAVEVAGPCGTGLCQGCAVPVVGRGGVERYARACADGPVFRGEQVRW